MKKKKQVDKGKKLYTFLLNKDALDTVKLCLKQKKKWHKLNSVGKVDNCVISWIGHVEYQIKKSTRAV